MAKKKGIIQGPWPKHNRRPPLNASYIGEANNVVHGWWTRDDNSSISPKAFRIRIQRLSTNLAVALDELSFAYKLFENEKQIWPDQCSHAISLINNVGEPVQELCQLLETTSRLPDVAIPLRYPIVVALHDANKQVKDVIALVTQLCMNQTSSGYVVKQPQEIQYRLESITRTCNDILQKGYRLLEEVRSQQKRIANL